MIHLYVEHLLNIRALSIQASLSTTSNKETKVTLSADGSILTLAHEGEVATVKLPVNISPNQQSLVSLTIPAVPSKDLSFRISVEEKADSKLLGNGHRESGNIIPWTADALTGETEICCRYCSSIFVDRGKVKTCKDLPSEGWAEMMEFWHCHKPHEPHDHDQYEVKKAYGADSKFAVNSGVGLVDVVDFLFVPEDCKNISTSRILQKDRAEDMKLRCSNCKTQIGQVEPSTQAYKLRKFHLSISVQSNMNPTAYRINKWLACFLLSSVENQGVRKFVLRNKTGSARAMKLWIFSPDLIVSSSALEAGKPTRFTKVLWQNIDGLAESFQMLNAESLFEGELIMRKHEINLLREELERSSEIIPKASRRFQEWHVGLLERFTEDDIQRA